MQKNLVTLYSLQQRVAVHLNSIHAPNTWMYYSVMIHIIAINPSELIYVHTTHYTRRSKTEVYQLDFRLAEQVKAVEEWTEM